MRSHGQPIAWIGDLPMHIGLIIYGSLDTLSGGYLYDRVIVRHLEAKGHQVEIISLPWRNYSAHLLDNWNSDLLRRLRQTPFDVLIQDELNRENLKAALEEILNPEKAAELRAGYAELRHKLGDGGASEKAASTILKFLEK